MALQELSRNLPSDELLGREIVAIAYDHPEFESKNVADILAYRYGYNEGTYNHWLALIDKHVSWDILRSNLEASRL